MRVSPLFCFPCFVQCFVICYPWDLIAALFTSLAREDLPLLVYVVEFSQLAILTAFDDSALNSLLWIGGNYHYPVDLPDTTGLSWRASILDPEHSQTQSPANHHPAVWSSSPPMMESSSPTRPMSHSHMGRQSFRQTSCVDPVAPPWLLAPSSLPWPSSPLAPPGSLVPPAQPLSVVDHPSPRDCTPLAAPHPSGSIQLLLHFGFPSVLCRSGSTVAFRLSISASGCSAAIVRPSGVISPSFSMASLSVGSTMGHHYAVAWVPPGSPCSKPLLSPSSPPRLLPHHLHHGLCLPAPSRVSVLLSSLLPSSHPSLPVLFL